MHYQAGASAHDKLVCCLKGRVLDVVVDIRPESPVFNQPVSIELSQHLNNVLFIPQGYGHGFLSLEDDSWILYSTSTVYDKDMDCGVLWSSIDFDWPVNDPILSHRDTLHPSIEDLDENSFNGSNWFIGSHFTKQALEAGHTVLAIRRSIESTTHYFHPATLIADKDFRGYYLMILSDVMYSFILLSY